MHPFIEIAGITISAWRILVMLGGVLSWILILIRAKRLGFSTYPVFLFLVMGLLVGTLGGHIFNFLIPYAVGVGAGANDLLGLTATGSIITGVAFVYAYSKYVLKANPLEFMDMIAFSFPLTVFFGRAGCIASGCCFGRITPEWTTSSFVSFFVIGTDNFIPSTAAWTFYRDAHEHIWNVPLLLMVNSILALAVAEWLYRSKNRLSLPNGVAFFSTLTVYSLGRFFVEFLREEKTINSSILNPWQSFVLVIFAVSASILFTLLRRKNTKTDV